MKLLHLPPFTPLLNSSQSFLRLVVCLGVLFSQPLFAAEGDGAKLAQASSHPSPPPKTKTVIADLLMIDGAFYVVRGDRGEIRIEITPDTQLSESFTFGDRIKAILLPNDEALSITKAKPGESIGTTIENPASTPNPMASSSSPQTTTPSPALPSTSSSTKKEAEVRIIIADLLMVDRNLYIIRSEYGEIQIEVTPQTQLSETFQFGDRIKARVTPDDKALSIVRANPGESPGIRLEKTQKPSTPTVPPASPSGPVPANKEKPATAPPKESSKIRTVVAEILMIDGPFYVVRGDRGEIRIEVTPETNVTESFKFGDTIKAKILPNDIAVSIERAKPDEPLGVSAP